MGFLHDASEQRLTVADVQAAIRAMGQLPVTGSGRLTSHSTRSGTVLGVRDGPNTGGLTFVARIIETDSGDFSDERYYVALQTPVGGSDDTMNLLFSEGNADHDPSVVVAHNLSEWADGGGSHSLPTDGTRYVKITAVEDHAGATRWVMSEGGTGTIQLKITAITASAGAKYSVVEVTPPTSDVASSGDATTSDLGTVGSTTCIGIDENEIGRASHSHLNHVNAEVEGTILRTNSDGTKVYRFRQAPGPDVHFEVSLTQTGGSDGDKTHAASWTYTVAGLNGEQLGTVVSPEKPRPNGTSTAATAGEAYYTAAGALVLAEAYEKYGTGSC